MSSGTDPDCAPAWRDMNQGSLFSAEPIARALITHDLDEAHDQHAREAAAADEFRERFIPTPQLGTAAPPTTLSPEEAAIVREALSYTLSRRSAGCPYAPEWEDGQVVEVAGPLLGRLKC